METTVPPVHQTGAIPLKFKLMTLGLLCIGFIIALLALAPQSQTARLIPTQKTIFWNNGSNAPIALFESQGIVAQGKLFVFGGFYTHEVHATGDSFFYDPKTDSWTQIASLPEPVTHAGITTDGTTVYLAGGFVGSHPGPITNHVWKYDIATDTWSQGVSLPEQIAAGALVFVNGELHYFGGGTRGDSTNMITVDSEKHWVFDLATSTTWEEQADFPNPRNHLSSVALQGKIYAIGGQHLEDVVKGNQASVHMYDPQKDIWKEVAPLPIPIGHTSAFVLSDEIYIVGGFTNASRVSSLIYSYSPKDKAWKERTALPQEVQAAVAGAIDGNVYVTTGRNAKNDLLQQTFRGNLQYE